MTITSDVSVGSLAAEHPLATRVFARHEIDYCCGGGRPLGEACAEKGLDTEAVIDEIRKELETTDPSKGRWDQAALGDLIDHILTTYHRSLDEELPRLQSMAERVLDVHRDKDPERLPELLSVFLGLKSELEEHMVKEEQILFPMIRSGQGAMATGPIAAMEHDHASVGAVLRRLQELTDGYEVPAGACDTWRALWHGLAALEEALHEHIHLENNILFPRALAS
ncbi:MAG TPA: iron-sulfur cluster repair di-iron protein [Acidobacteria bacterium]|mgnify:CR=1 FL=1|jgi:regulator of cell morphogenesis and NO signaling|nr:iron-sulfur cluster repair di-iron protein [Acidobacteriota bacterium]MDP6372719.1 iron-sulfur cluster repair di-iron protein [Vicinamibacterales bacterium]HAK54628.1 iron-sulfur cluster repair di-iron protein [Acidobacteriota bacterium]|tara:strand:+ start:96 stop:767 length:672 start_codon:yes stop_codon:yes gene_type:complete